MYLILSYGLLIGIKRGIELYCDNCLNWENCKEIDWEERPILEFDDGTVWCRDKRTQEQMDFMKLLERGD